MISAISLPVCTPAVTELYNINIICTIHPDSTADQCVVMAMADDEDTKAGEIRKVLFVHIGGYVYVDAIKVKKTSEIRNLKINYFGDSKYM